MEAISTTEILIATGALVASTIIGLLVKEAVSAQIAYSALRDRLQRVAGKGSVILYGNKKYTIESFDRRALVLRGKYGLIFVPARNIQQQTLTVPAENYDDILAQDEREAQKKAIEKMLESSEAMMEYMMPKMFEHLQSAMVDSVADDSGDVSIAIGMKIVKVLEESGIEVKELAELKDKKPAED